MFSLAYVMLPFSDTPPAQAIAASLARFQRGGRGDVPEDWVRFHDTTAEVRALHEATFAYTRDRGLHVEGADDWLLDRLAMSAEIKRRGRDRWRARFADIEPDLDSFARRFVRPFDRHPVTNGFGSWLNPLGQWDWWDLGGRFDGRISGARRRKGRGRSSVSSGHCLGRAAFEKLGAALETAIGQEPEAEVDVRTDENVELVSSLLENLDNNIGNGRLPGALVLPPGAAHDDARWLNSWPEVGSPEGLSFLGLAPDIQWREVARAAYVRFRDHWAAGVSFHF